jgi:hypothetical protein
VFEVAGLQIQALLQDTVVLVSLCQSPLLSAGLAPNQRRLLFSYFLDPRQLPYAADLSKVCV